MSEQIEFPNDVYREAHGRILGSLPALQRMFRTSTAWKGDELEKLLVSIWLMGYTGALDDMHEGGAELPKDALPPVMDWLVLKKEKA